MEFVKGIINGLLSFKSYVMLPILMFILSCAIGIKLKKALKASITLGIGFIGIFIVFDHFVNKIGPVLKLIIQRTGISQDVLDVGWPPLAGITWSFKLAPILILLIMLVNVVMLIFKLTNTINIDIWNYWHFIFAAQLVYFISGNFILAISSALILLVVCIKLADWSVEDVAEISGVQGISITTLSGLSYYSITLFLDKIFDKIPVINKLKADPEHIKEKLGFFGEPMFLGIVMGIVLGITAGYSIKDILDLSLNIAAVIYILPKMSEILGEGLMPISEGMKEFMLKKFPSMKNTYIGLDLALLIGNPAVIVTGILLMPVALILAFLLPGVRFIPLGDLPNTIGAVVMIVVATKGNVVRAFIAGIPIVIGKLYAASAMADVYTGLAAETGYKVSGYSGSITSFLDGGNLMRFWLVKLSAGNMLAIAFIPIVLFLLYFTWRLKASNRKNVSATSSGNFGKSTFEE
jgi:PTS system galactitol-specific IIC component